MYVAEMIVRPPYESLPRLLDVKLFHICLYIYIYIYIFIVSFIIIH